MRFVTFFLFLVLAYFFASKVLLVYPAAGFPVAIAILTTGVVILVVFAIFIDRYKDVFDYEATTLWGRETNGKKARSQLGNIMIFGTWMIVVGILFFVLSSLHKNYFGS